MITENEQAKIKEVRDAILDSVLTVHREDASEELKAAPLV